MLRSLVSAPHTRNLCLTASLTIFLALGAPKPAAEAAFHLWQVKEVFTNADGSVQFVEMFDTAPGETLMAGKTITANSGVGNVKTFTFPSNLTKATDNHSLLIATSGFGSLAGGVTPDFTFADGGVTAPLFNPNASNITITFSGSGSSMSFTGAQLPKNGVDSINRPTTIAINSPTNLDGSTGSVNLSAPSPTGDYNGNQIVDAADYAVWRKTLTSSASPAGSGADGDSSGTIDIGDYTYWRARFGNAAPGSAALVGGVIPEPTTVALQFGWLLALTWRIRNRSSARGER